jgi:YfiH family protein
MTGTTILNNAGLHFSNLESCENISHFVTACHDAATISSQINARVYTSTQIHRDNIAVVGRRTERLSDFDALIAHEPDICVAVSTADCVPILIYAPDLKVIAAIHAGWRGTVLKIALKTVRRMIEFGCNPGVMLAGIAPSISLDAFEVGGEVPEKFTAAGIDIAPISRIHPDTGKTHIDLKKANLLQLLDAGLQRQNIEVSPLCTFRDSRFLSARRLGIDCGRMLTGIIMRK